MMGVFLWQYYVLSVEKRDLCRFAARQLVVYNTSLNIKYLYGFPSHCCKWSGQLQMIRYDKL